MHRHRKQEVLEEAAEAETDFFIANLVTVVEICLAEKEIARLLLFFVSRFLLSDALRGSHFMPYFLLLLETFHIFSRNDSFSPRCRSD